MARRTRERCRACFAEAFLSHEEGGGKTKIHKSVSSKGFVAHNR